MIDFGIFIHLSQIPEECPSLPMKLETADSKPGRYSLKQQVLLVVPGVSEDEGSLWLNCTSHSSALHENAKRWQGQGLDVVSSEVPAQADVFLLVFEISRFVYNQINGCFLGFFPQQKDLGILLKTHRWI